ncbi:MAG: M48 family metalloprotease [Burkholderiales bacterium]|nr:M48 family metalloprotease [Burkholderiales bacterium]
MSRFSLGKRISLTALTLAMESIYAFVAFVPVLLIVALCAFFYGFKAAAVIGILLFLGFWWLIQPHGDIVGWTEEIPSSAPIWSQMRELCLRVDAPLPHRLLLVDEFNASAHQSSGFLSLVGAKRTVLIGIPLLHLLSTEEVRAVLAHELGHLSRRHGRLGHWIYRVRAKWESYAYAPGRSDDTISDAMRGISDWLVPFFLRRTAAWSLHCEFEADHSAKDCGLGGELANALMKLDHVAAIWNGSVRQAMTNEKLIRVTPPDQFWQVVRTLAVNTVDAGHHGATLRRRRSLGVHQVTHPPTSERIHALGVADRCRLVFDDAGAGPACLGERWSEILAGCERRRFEATKTAWRLDHYRLQRYAQLTNRTNVSDLVGIDAQLERAVAADLLGPSTVTLGTLRALAAENLDCAMARYQLGAALLRRDDDTGVPELQAAYRLDRTFAPEATLAIFGYKHEFETYADAMDAWGTVLAAKEWEHLFTENLWRKLTTEILTAPSSHVSDLLSEAIASDDHLDAAWAVRLNSREINNRIFAINALVLRIRPIEVSKGDAVDEDEFAAQYGKLFSTLLPPNELVRVLTFYTTEPIDPKLLRQLNGVAGACIISPKVPVNVEIIKIDSM